MTGPEPAVPIRPTLPLVSVIVPAYNEAAILVDSLTRLTEHLAGLEDRYRWELVVVNDGSTDETGALADAFAVSHPNVRILHHRVNFHLGQALRYAFNSTHGDYVAVIDCDLSYDPEHLTRMLFTIEDSRARIVIASPYAKGGKTTNIPFTPPRDEPGRELDPVSRRRWWAHDAHGMVRVYDGRFLRSLDLRSMDTEINTEIVYKAQILHAAHRRDPGPPRLVVCLDGRHAPGGHELPVHPHDRLVTLLVVPVPPVHVLHAARAHPAGGRRVLVRLVRLARRSRSTGTRRRSGTPD